MNLRLDLVVQAIWRLMLLWSVQLLRPSGAEMFIRMSAIAISRPWREVSVLTHIRRQPEASKAPSVISVMKRSVIRRMRWLVGESLAIVTIELRNIPREREVYGW